MKLTRIMSISEDLLNELETTRLLKCRANTSWSGENAKQSFVNELKKDIEVVIFWEDVGYIEITVKQFLPNNTFMVTK